MQNTILQYTDKCALYLVTDSVLSEYFTKHQSVTRHKQWYNQVVEWLQDELLLDLKEMITCDVNETLPPASQEWESETSSREVEPLV